MFSYLLSRSSRERHKGPSAFPTLKQAYAHSPSLRRANESYPLSPTLCLTRTDFPPCPAQLRAGRDPRPAGASAWPFHVSTSSTDFRVADSERSEGGRLPRRAREQQPHSGRPSAGAGGGGAAGSRNSQYLDVFFEASPFRASSTSDAAGRRRRSRHVPRGFPSLKLVLEGTV